MTQQFNSQEVKYHCVNISQNNSMRKRYYKFDKCQNKIPTQMANNKGHICKNVICVYIINLFIRRFGSYFPASYQWNVCITSPHEVFKDIVQQLEMQCLVVCVCMYEKGDLTFEEPHKELFLQFWSEHGMVRWCKLFGDYVVQQKQIMYRNWKLESICSWNCVVSCMISCN